MARCSPVDRVQGLGGSTYTIYLSRAPSSGQPGLPGLQDVSVRDANELLQDGHLRHAAVLLVDSTLLQQKAAISALRPEVVVVANDAASEQSLGDRVDLSVASLADESARTRMLRVALELAEARAANIHYRLQLVCARRDLHELNTIAAGLMSEPDREALLRRIVEQGKVLTDSDAGCLFLVEQTEKGVDRLRPAVYSSDSLAHLPAPGAAEALPMDDSSIIGHCATSKHHITIDDAYNLDRNSEFGSNIDFERQFGYHVQSMLVLPMLDRNETVVGVLAFVNRKRERSAMVRDQESARRWVLPYTRHEVALGRALASVAAASIENRRLYGQIENLLESFVKAAVSAIDERDPTTAGHSLRVAVLTTALADAVQRGGSGPYRNMRFTRAQMRELHFAALLHDLGKVTVKEDVLTKAKKLPPQLWERVSARFELIRCLAHGDPGRLEEIDAMWSVVQAANEPGPALESSVLDSIAELSYRPVDTFPAPYLTQEELGYLKIPHGTLDERERREVQSHAEQTYQFLLQIPWTDDLKNLARYAHGHHEKLDGSGYPQHLRGAEIPVQTRLMTIADIFDALTAWDRPYRRAIPADKALDIIRQEARDGLLDAELVRVLVESRVYDQILRLR